MKVATTASCLGLQHVIIFFIFSDCPECAFASCAVNGQTTITFHISATAVAYGTVNTSPVVVVFPLVRR